MIARGLMRICDSILEPVKTFDKYSVFLFYRKPLHVSPLLLSTWPLSDGLRRGLYHTTHRP